MRIRPHEILLAFLVLTLGGYALADRPGRCSARPLPAVEARAEAAGLLTAFKGIRPSRCGSAPGSLLLRAR